MSAPPRAGVVPPWKRAARAGRPRKRRRKKLNQEQKIIRGKVGVLERVKQLGNYAKVAFAKLDEGKTPITAADLLNDRLVPFFEENGIPLVRVLTDRGTEFCGTERITDSLQLAREKLLVA
jgi:hypothetical protein